MLAGRLFIRLFFTPLNRKIPESEQVIYRKAEQQVLRVNGKRIQLYSWGSGPLVLLAHGWAGRGTQFSKFVSPLTSAGYRVVGFDGPAHGRSQGNRTDILEYKTVLDRIVQAIGTPRACITHSFGGTALLYAISEGLRIPVLVSIAGPSIGDKIIGTYLTTLNASARTGNIFREYIMKRTGKSFDEWCALAFITRVPATLKLLLVHDEEDKEVTPDHSHALADRFPAAKLHLTRGLGHYRILKDEAVIAAILSFVVENDRNEM